ncbi:MAG: Lrp/AsnC family transcriptional regulator [Bacteroidales bacterium]|nr:Lrp/AsnC family transcriptional regulator [Bacteroidales bacterium]
MSNRQLDSLDKQILSMIAEDARMPFLEVARVCGVSGAAIHQRVQRLVNLGVVKGTQYVLDPEKLGYETCAYLGVYLSEPGRFDEITKEVEKIPEVVECHCITGRFDMFVKIYARSNHHLLNIIHDKLQPLGVVRTETIMSFKQTIQRQIPIPNPNTDK